MADGTDQAKERQKTFIEGIQGIIKAKQEGFAEYQQSIAKSHQTRSTMALKHSESTRDSGDSQQSPKEMTGFSREAQAMLQC